MDGDLDFVKTVDGDDAVSVPRRVLSSIRARRPELDDFDVRARFTVFAAMQLGWTAFEELIFMNAEVAPEERDAFRERVKQAMQKMLDRSLEGD